MNKKQNKLRTIKQQTTGMVMQALQETGGNVAAAARLLGIGRATIYRLMDRHHITNRRRA